MKFFSNKVLVLLVFFFFPFVSWSTLLEIECETKIRNNSSVESSLIRLSSADIESKNLLEDWSLSYDKKNIKIKTINFDGDQDAIDGINLSVQCDQEYFEYAFDVSQCDSKGKALLSIKPTKRSPRVRSIEYKCDCSVS